MSVLSDLTAEINSQLPTGVSHQITAAKVRTVLTDMATQLIASQAVTGGGGSAERYLTSTTTADAGDICFCNTAAGGFTVTLPATPVPGTGVGFRDAESSWSASNLTVNPGSNKIEGSTGNLVCDVTNANFDIVWSGTADGWQVVPIISFAGTSGGTTGTGTGSTYIYVSGAQTIPIGAIAYCDTIGGSFVVTLPTGPTIGSGMSFRDFSGSWGVSHLILNPGSNPINSNASNFTVDQQDINFDLVWRGLPIGWQVMVPIYDGVRGGAVNRLLATQTLGALGQTITATRAGGSAITWSPTDKVSNISLSSGNLTGTATATSNGLIRATGPGSVNRYFEVTWSTSVPSGSGISISNSTQSLTTYPGDPNSIGFFNSHYVEWPGGGNATDGPLWTTGDVMGIQLLTSSVKLFKNGVLAYTVNTLPTGLLYPSVWMTTASESMHANFGATTMAFLPTGATSWDGSQVSTGGGGGAATTWNPSDQSGETLTNSNLTVTGTGTGGGQVRATRSNTSGHYFEVTVDVGGSSASPLYRIGQCFPNDYERIRF